MSGRIIVYREVESEAGREYVWWTVRDRGTGYNKTFRTEEQAVAHAAALRGPSTLKTLRCFFSGHKWVERKPHRMWDINDYDCARCGAQKREGITGKRY